MSENKLIIAAAGSGKTTHLVEKALSCSESNVLILTYTLSNEASIKANIRHHANCIPKNITVQTWFSFLLQHGVKPYQGSLDESLFDQDIRGMIFVTTQSAVRYQGRFAPVCWKETEHFHKHYFTDNRDIYSDKISKFTVKCNEKSGNAVVDRLAEIYDLICIDEIQDLAGYDLNLIMLLFKSSASILLVGDPRQVTYLTHIENKFKKYRNGRIKDFVESKDCRGTQCEVDETTLSVSHRNNLAICEYSSRLYSEFSNTLPCTCCREHVTNHEGVFLLKPDDVDAYTKEYDVIQLRWNSRKQVHVDMPVMNFGESKGHTFDRVLIYPTDKMIEWITDNEYKLSDGARAKFYVALTRAKHSVAIVMNYNTGIEYQGVTKLEDLSE
jgi:DNA helicase-2/ATP-dependent DNA helicase PcrA